MENRTKGNRFAITVVDNIHAIRQRKGLSIFELEDRVGVYSGYFSRIYKDQKKKIGFDVLVNCAQVLGTTVDTLCDLDCVTLSPDAIMLNDFLIKLGNKTCQDELVWKKQEPDSLATVFLKKDGASVILTWEPFPDSKLGIIQVSVSMKGKTDVIYDSERDQIPAITRTAVNLYGFARDNEKRPHMDEKAIQFMQEFLENK